jgi:hypothetical protein
MPQPGTPFPTGWLYIEVLRTDIKQQRPNFTNYASIEPYTSIEAYFHGRCIGTVSKKDIIDNSRVYRFPNTALRQFPQDCNDPPGRYLPVGASRFEVLTTDPSLGKAAKTALWTPIG